jgi:hypothetical protein
MPLKGSIKPDHIPNNKFDLLVVGAVPPIPPLTTVAISGIEQTLKLVDLPDGTKASAGETDPIEFDMTLPTHHLLEEAAMEIWYQEGKNPVSPGYKKGAVLILKSLSENTRRSYTMIGLFVTKRTLPDLEMAGDGEQVSTVWGMSCDDIIATP